MIKSAEEFIELRDLNNQRASFDSAEFKVWMDVIKDYPDYRIWVIHNKSVPIEILEILTLDPNPLIRGEVARKRKINQKIFDLLKLDNNESVRFGLMSNSKISIEQLSQIKVEDSEWLKKMLSERLNTKI